MSKEKVYRKGVYEVVGSVVTPRDKMTITASAVGEAFVRGDKMLVEKTAIDRDNVYGQLVDNGPYVILKYGSTVQARRTGNLPVVPPPTPPVPPKKEKVEEEKAPAEASAPESVSELGVAADDSAEPDKTENKTKGSKPKKDK